MLLRSYSLAALLIVQYKFATSVRHIMSHAHAILPKIKASDGATVGLLDVDSIFRSFMLFTISNYWIEKFFVIAYVT